VGRNLRGSPFALTVTLPTSEFAITPTVDVDGTFGSQYVRFTVGPARASSTTAPSTARSDLTT
jgi:hypothetical protein